MSSQTSQSFEIEVSFRKVDGIVAQRGNCSGEPVTFKIDGHRFQTSSKTVKFHSDSVYAVTVAVTPPVNFEWLRIAGSNLPLENAPALQPSRRAYSTMWKTDGITPTNSGKRETITFTLQGNDANLAKTLQCKFYAKNDSHAEWGSALDSIVLKCTRDPQGTILVTDEQFK